LVAQKIINKYLQIRGGDLLPLAVKKLFKNNNLLRPDPSSQKNISLSLDLEKYFLFSKN